MAQIPGTVKIFGYEWDDEDESVVESNLPMGDPAVLGVHMKLMGACFAP